MKYVSSRNGNESFTFEQVLFSSYANDGGLYMPEKIPHISSTTLQSWVNFDYPSIVKEIVSLFVSNDEIPRDDLDEIIRKAFKDFTNLNIIPIKYLKDGLKIAELYHGETLAFKDLALSVVGKLMDYFLSKKNRHVIVLVATAGDTGSSAIYSVRQSKWIDIIVLFPKYLCTKVQVLQMTTVLDENVHCYAVEATSDELDEPIKKCFMDRKFAETYNLCCLNSINWARIMIQIAHYFYIYMQINKKVGPLLNFAVPTGAAGNITAGCIAKMMGLPIELIACVNINNSVYNFVMEGTCAPSEAAAHTLASAMDIQVPYNVERLLHLVSNGDTSLVKQFFQNGWPTKTEIIDDKLKDKCHNLIMKSHSSSDDVITKTIDWCWKENNYQICPHTATAVTYYTSQTKTSEENSQCVCLATASPAKFPEVLESLGITPLANSKLQKLMFSPTKQLEMKHSDDWFSILKLKIYSISEKWILEEIAI